MSSPTSSPSGRPSHNPRLVVMAKYPVPGRVKTRLAAELGTEVATALYRAFVLDLAARLADLPYGVTWAYWPADAPFSALLPGARCRAQEGLDLGERMEHALAAEFAAGECPVLALGADAPHLPAAVLAEAAEALVAGVEVVLGPALDGGYYLIGLNAPCPALFADIAWGTTTVLEATRERALRMGLSTHLLPPSFDIDEVADLGRLRAMLARGETDLPRTAALLAALDRQISS
jgi:rSAM/selenodomain-associated transferase 1